MPIAFLSGMVRDSRCMPPAPAARPTRGSGSANFAWSEAMMRSQASAISKPPPMATPLTAAITGLSRSWRLVRPPKPLGGDMRPPAGLGAQLGVILEVVAGRERLVAGAGDDRDPQLGIGRELVEDVRQLLVRHRVQRVVDLRAVDGDDQQVAVDLGLAVLAALLAHGCLLRARPAWVLGGCPILRGSAPVAKPSAGQLETVLGSGCLEPVPEARANLRATAIS